MAVAPSRSRSRAATWALLALVPILGALTPDARAGQAPGAPGTKHAWDEADKHGFGTATALASPVWFTLRAAELSDVYYPDLSTPSLRSLEFVVTDGRTFTDRETGPGVTSRVRPVPGSLTFVQTTRTARWKLVKTWVTDPGRSTVLADVRFTSLTGRRLRVYALVDPALADTGNDDRARTGHSSLVAWDDHAASAVAAAPALRRGTSGYAGTQSDPWTMLSTRRNLTAHDDAPAPGNVVQAAQTRLTGVAHGRRMTLAVGFGGAPEAAQEAARRSLATGFDVAAGRYAGGWARYQRGLKTPPAPVAADARMRELYSQSVMTLAAHEDKANRGAYVASPTMPWVWGKLTLEKTETSGPYHLVWPRDLYHIATALESAGDAAGARRALDYLWRVQKPDGSWWQNTRVDGREHWTTTQMDQVALPAVLAWWLHRTSAADWEHVRAAGDYLVANGPRTGQERWENQDGWSPNTIATEIAGLVCAAEIAQANGDEARAQSYRATADAWQRQVESWTATTNGPYEPRPYYVRVTKDGNPDDGSTYSLGDNFPRPVDEREIVDPSFLGLVLFGAKRWDDPTILNTLAVVDRPRDAGGLRVETPDGPAWHRFTYDGYGETRDGGDWDIFPTAENQTLGRLWPLLAGERGEYELVAGRDATPYLRAVAGAANDGLMLPEQVWDGRPPTGAPGAGLGDPTRSATPLAWTHGQFIRLAWSIQEHRPVELPTVVAARYGAG